VPKKSPLFHKRTLIGIGDGAGDLVVDPHEAHALAQSIAVIWSSDGW
jgi:hypothetical protein